MRKLQILALILGLISIPISFLALTFGPLVADEIPIRLWLYFFVAIHPISAILFYFKRKFLYLWLFVLAGFSFLYVFDMVKTKHDRETFSKEQFIKCEKIKKECKPEYEHMYSWWLCPESSSYNATEFLRCGDFYQTEEDREKLHSEFYSSEESSTQSSENPPGLCRASDLLINFIELNNISIGDVVGFNISSNPPFKCANGSVDVGFSVFDTNGSLLSGVGGPDLLDGNGSLTRSYEIQPEDIHQDGAAGIEAIVKIEKTGELIGRESWYFENKQQ